VIQVASVNGKTVLALIPGSCRHVRRETTIEGWARQWDPPRRTIIEPELRHWLEVNAPEGSVEIQELEDSVVIGMPDDVAFWFKVRWH
jgi:hypothetical protein